MGMSFDGATKRITLTAGTTSLSVLDLWSRYADWLETGDNSKYGEALRQIGGDSIEIPIYVFLLNGWRIVPQSANHSLAVTHGVLYVDGGGDPFVDPAGSFSIRINRETPGIAIGYSTSGGSGGATPAQIWQHTIEGMTAEQMMRVALAALAGKSVGVGTATEQYMAQDGTTPRIAAEFDAQGNRINVTLDGG